MRKTKQSIKAWAGFTDGKLLFYTVDDCFGGSNYHESPAIFKTRKEAKAQFEDVRRVEIKEVNG